MRRILIGLAVVTAASMALMVALFLIGTHIRSENATKCVKNDLAGCTAVTQSGGESTPNLAIYHLNRGIACATTNQHDEALADYTQAIADYTRAITLKLDYALAYNNRGIAYCNENLHDQSINNFIKAIEINPKYASAYNNRGVSYHLIGEDTKARFDAEEAVAPAPNDGNHLETRAEIHEKLGLRAEAIADYRAALTLEPHMRDAEGGLKRLGAAP
jgi:tetratricopeptide (TPR) repeat protein